jgi:hypothetical protein
MVGIDEPTHCRGCGRPIEVCAGSCGRSGPDQPPRFCPQCGWRLREIAVVPGVGGLWCRTHGVQSEDGPGGAFG